MKKLLALACAGSVLALASGANAQSVTQYSLTVQGTINPFCSIADTADALGTTATFDNTFDNGTGGIASGSSLTKLL